MKNTPSGLKFVLLIIGLVVAAYLVMDFNNRMSELRRLTADQELVRQQLDHQVQTQAALQTQISYASSDQAVEDWAYNDAKMVRPGDNPVAPLPAPGSTLAPTRIPAPVPTQVDTWQAWWSLIFGPDSSRSSP